MWYLDEGSSSIRLSREELQSATLNILSIDSLLGGNTKILLLMVFFFFFAFQNKPQLVSLGCLFITRKKKNLPGHV